MRAGGPAHISKVLGTEQGVPAGQEILRMTSARVNWILHLYKVT